MAEDNLVKNFFDLCPIKYKMHVITGWQGILYLKKPQRMWISSLWFYDEERSPDVRMKAQERLNLTYRTATLRMILEKIRGKNLLIYTPKISLPPI